MICICKNKAGALKLTKDKATADALGLKIICRRKLKMLKGDEPDWQKLKKVAIEKVKTEITARQWKSSFNIDLFNEQWDKFKTYWTEKKFMRKGRPVKNWKATARRWFKKWHTLKKSVSYNKEPNTNKKYDFI